MPLWPHGPAVRPAKGPEAKRRPRRFPTLPAHSPRTRGCFHIPPANLGPGNPFPTHAGVFPRRRCETSFERSFPRARGGVSSPLCPGVPVSVPSPRTWGCSRELHHHDHRRRVFPSFAGAKNFNYCFKFLENHPAEAGKGVFLPRSETRRSGAAEPRGERHAATLRFFFRSKETSFCARDARDAAAHFRKISLSVS